MTSPRGAIVPGYEFVIVERREAAGIVTINRPQVLNALHEPANRELLEAIAELDGDGDVRSLIITGAGDRAFCTGWDLEEAAVITTAAAEGRTIEQRYSEQLYSGLKTWKPVIGAINGYCIAGGLELALMCDMLVGAEHAEFGLQEVRWAILPGGGGTQRLPRAVPLNIANEMILTGKRIDAATAFRAGLLNRLVPRERVLEEALEIARAVARCGPIAVRNAKRSIREGMELPLPEGLANEIRLYNELVGTEDAKEGPRAFLEKREPRYTGR